MQTLLGALVCGDLARYDADETKKRTASKKKSNIMAGRVLTSKGGKKLFLKTDSADVQATAIALHESLPCASGSDGRGRDQMWKRLMRTIRVLWEGQFQRRVTGR